MRLSALALIFFNPALVCNALAQSPGPFVPGQPLTAASLNAALAAKYDYGLAPAYSTMCNWQGVMAGMVPCPAVTLTAPLTMTPGTATVSPVLDAHLYSVWDTNLGSTITIGANAGKPQDTVATHTYNDTAIGSNALGGSGPGITSAAVQNIAVGALALANLTSGFSNTAVGFGALFNALTSSNSTCVGRNACQGTGANNTAVGAAALGANGTGSGNSVLGQAAGAQETNGSNNSYFGFSAGQFITTGQNNIIIGANSTGGIAGCPGTPANCATGNSNVIIGGAVANLAGAIANTIQIGDGAGNVRWDYGLTTAGRTTFAGGPIAIAYSIPTVIYSAAGTALPACAAATNGATAIVSDATAATYAGAYASGGTQMRRVLCVSGAGWITD
jgi:hypothetical protein